MHKIKREYTQLCAQIGVDLLQIGNRKGHLALHTASGTIFVSGTPSDCRNRSNVLAQIKRMARS